MLECLTVVSVAATATTRAAIGSCVLQLPLRSPAVVAKQAATLQVLSGGRLVLGVGVGEHAGEYEAAGSSFLDRGRRLDAGIETLRRAWASGGDTGRRYRQEPEPAPIPVWVGGSSPAAVRRAARRGDGWVPLFLGPAAFADRLATLRGEAEAAGRDPAEVAAAAVVFLHVGPAREAQARGTAWLSSLYGIPPRAFARHLVAGPPAACADRVGAYLAAGADHVAVMVADDDPIEHFAALAGEVERCRAGAPVAAPVTASPAAPERLAAPACPEPVEVLL